jgi:adenylosuccinate lyase
LIFQKRALDLILPKLAKVIQNLQEFALKYKDMPTLGFTHYQPVRQKPARW